MLARANRNSESTIAFQLSVVVEGLFPMHPCKKGGKHKTTNYRFQYFITLILQNLYKIWYW